MSASRKIVLPVVVLAAGLGVAAVLLTAGPDVERDESPTPAPLVRTVTAETTTVAVRIASRGSVEPATEAALVAQVGGRVDWVAPTFADGGFFARGDVLVRLEDADYRLAVDRARAEVAFAEMRLAQLEAEAEVALEEWAELGEGEAPPLVARVPQLGEAEASVAGARAALAQAELQLERTAIRAPFDGRVRETRADVGQYVAPGTPLGEVFAVDRAEVGLPVTVEEIAFLDLPLGFTEGEIEGPRVTLSARLGDGVHTWPARVVRTGGALDPKTRMLELVAAVDDPFARRVADRLPLPMGMFVEAEIEGRPLEGAIALPRAALHGDSQVLVVEDGSRLAIRDVTIARRTRDEILVTSGISAGELVCLSRLEAVVDGMAVRVAEPGAPS